jgi:hypothetical protein
MPTADTPSRDALAGPSWAAYLATLIARDAETGATCIGHQRLSVADARQAARWLREGVRPSFWTADAFLIRYRLHIDLFFAFASERGDSPWAHGNPPAWHEADWRHEDANWRDPEPEVLAA